MVLNLNDRDAVLDVASCKISYFLKVQLPRNLRYCMILREQLLFKRKHLNITCSKTSDCGSKSKLSWPDFKVLHHISEQRKWWYAAPLDYNGRHSATNFYKYQNLRICSDCHEYPAIGIIFERGFGIMNRFFLA